MAAQLPYLQLSTVLAICHFRYNSNNFSVVAQRSYQVFAKIVKAAAVICYKCNHLFGASIYVFTYYSAGISVCYIAIRNILCNHCSCPNYAIATNMFS